MWKFALIIAAMLSAGSTSARAEEKMVVDMRKLTCAQLTRLGFQDFAGVTMWLSGYYNSSIRNTVVDLEQFARAASKVKEFCQTNARATVLSAAERVLGIQDAAVSGRYHKAAQPWYSVADPWFGGYARTTSA